jgi:hypothetical protein
MMERVQRRMEDEMELKAWLGGERGRHVYCQRIHALAIVKTFSGSIVWIYCMSEREVGGFSIVAFVICRSTP